MPHWGGPTDQRSRTARALVNYRVDLDDPFLWKWVESDRISKLLKEGLPHDFDAHIQFVMSYTARLSHSLGPVIPHRRADEWYIDVALSMTHARCANTDPGYMQSIQLNVMDSFLSRYWWHYPLPMPDHWARRRKPDFPLTRDPFRSLAAKYGLYRYFLWEFREPRPDLFNGTFRIPTQEPKPLLSCATQFLCSRNNSIFPLSDPRLVRFLITHSAPYNPGVNHGYLDARGQCLTTPWVTLLRSLRRAHLQGCISAYDMDPEGRRRWVPILRSFILDGGADVETVVYWGWGHQGFRMTALEIIEMLIASYGIRELIFIRRCMIERIEAMNRPRWPGHRS